MTDTRLRAARPLELLVFEVASDELALDTRALREVRRRPAGQPDAAGADVRVVDLRARLGCAPTGREQRLVVVLAGGRPLGLVVDRICEVVRLSVDAVADPPANTGVDPRLLAGAVTLDERVVLVLSPAALVDEAGSLAA